MMRVLHIWNDYSPALFDQSHPISIENGLSSRLLAGNLIDNGAKLLPETYVFRQSNPVGQNSAAFGWRLYRRARRLFFFPHFRHFCLQHVRQYRPDLAHIHFGTTAAGLLPFLEKAGVPVIVSLYGVDASAALADPVVVQRYRTLFARGSIFVVLSEVVRQRLVTIGCDTDQIRIINLPAGVEHYPLRSREFDGTTRFLIAARFVEKKGHVVLLHAFREVVNAGAKVHLTMMGYGPSGWLQELVRTLNLEDHTTLINNGLTPDFVGLFNGLLAEHDVFLAPSTTAANGDDEGGPALTMVAAQAAGMPVIATPFVGAELSLIPGETGLYCEQDSMGSLADRMLELCDQPELWKRLGENGSRLVRREFSRSGYAQTLLGLYKELA